MIVSTLRRHLRRSIVAGAVLGGLLVAGTAGHGSRPAAAAGLFKADLHVSGETRVQLGGAGMYTFKVTNKGTVDAHDVAVHGQCTYRDKDFPNVTGLAQFPPTVIPTLGTVKVRETRTVNLFCPALSSEGINVGYTGRVVASNELDMSDNVVAIGQVH